MNITLRPYQQECVDLINSLPEGSKGIVALATGLGKTICFTSLKRDGRILILSHRDELVRQPLKYFSNDVTTGIEKASEHSSGTEDIVSASVQTISQDKRLTKFKPDEFSMVIVDEAHHAAAPTYRKVLNYFKPKVLLGFTATPKRGDNVRLDDLFDSIIYEKDILWGIKNNYLCNIRAVAINANISLIGVKFTAGDYNARDLADRVEVEDVYETLAKAYGEYVIDTNRHVLLYCLTKEGCKAIQKYLIKCFPQEKNRIKIITADTPNEERQKLEKDYMNPEGKTRCLINCMVLTEGVDLPITDTIIILRPTANTSLYTQIVGRGTRLYEGKEECLVLEIMPKSNRKLCSMASLAGVDWDDLKKKQKELLEEGTDLVTLSEEIEKDKQKYKKRITLIATQIDLFNEKLQEEIEEIKNFVKSNVGEYSKYIADSMNQKIIDAAEEDGQIDHKGLLYTIGDSDEERYVINGEFNDACKICIAKPDVLGNSYITAYVNDKVYQSKEMKINDCFTSAKTVLDSCFKNKDYLWDYNANKRWKIEPATDKQIKAIHAMLLQKNYEFQTESLYQSGISKANASILINKLENENKLKNKISELKANLDELNKSGNKEEEEKPSNIIEWQTESIINKINGNKKEQIKLPESTLKFTDNGITVDCQITVAMWGKINSVAAPQQLTFLMSLLENAQRKIDFDIDINNDSRIQQGRSITISRLISLFMTLNRELNKLPQGRYEFKLDRMLDVIEQNNRSIDRGDYGRHFVRGNIIDKNNPIVQNISFVLYKED